jgi:hypothetical protein
MGATQRLSPLTSAAERHTLQPQRCSELHSSTCKVFGHCEVVFGLNFAVYSGTASVFSDMTNAVDGTGFQLKQTTSDTLGPNRLPGVRLKACDVSITVVIFVPIKLSINMLELKVTNMISTVFNPLFTAVLPNSSWI